MLVDSGATITALSERTAELASVDRSASLLPVIMRTANGTVRAETGVVDRLGLGSIEASNLKVVISPAPGTIDVLGMNFLSQPASWRRSEEHTSELQSLMRISYAVFCLKKKNNQIPP